MVAPMYRETRDTITCRRPADYGAERTNVGDWIQQWRERFGFLGVEVLVADVAQSSVVIDVPARTIILAPSLKLTCAEKILQKVYAWWRHQSGIAARQPYSFLSC
jgi:hypothetical protein